MCKSALLIKLGDRIHGFVSDFTYLIILYVLFYIMEYPPIIVNLKEDLIVSWNKESLPAQFSTPPCPLPKVATGPVSYGPSRDILCRQVVGMHTYAHRRQEKINCFSNCASSKSGMCGGIKAQQGNCPPLLFSISEMPYYCRSRS